MPNYVVDPLNGIDADSGLDGHPFKTPYKLTTVLRPGDFGIFRGGNYTVSDGGSLLVTRYSGTPTAPITFMRYGLEVPIFKGQARGINLGHSDLIFDGLAIINDSQSSGMVYGIDTPTNGPQRVTFKNMTIRNLTRAATSFGFNLLYLKYGKILNCAFDHIGCPADEGTESGNAIGLGGGWNLVEGCTIDYCGHAGIFATGAAAMFGHHILRKNLITGTWGICGEYLSYGTTANPILVDDNVFRNTSKLEDGLWNNSAWQQQGSRGILRRNRILNSIGPAVAFWSSAAYQTKYNRLYHNILYNCGYGGRYKSSPYQLNQTDAKGMMADNIVKNSIHFANAKASYYDLGDLADGSEITFLSNLWNLTNPLFLDEANMNFHLREGSPCINAGDFLTRTRSAGSGQSIPVLDSLYFCDGWGIIDADYIQLEGTDICTKILSIDHVNHVLNVADSLTWTAGQGVSLPFVGTKPDIGAFEYIGGYMATHSIEIILNILGISDYSLSVDATSKTFQRGESVIFKITATGIDGFAGSIPLTISGLPANVTAVFSPTSIKPGEEATLTIQSDLTAAPGAYTVTVKGPDSV